MQENWYELLLIDQQKRELEHILSYNKKTEQFGLVLTKEETQELLVCHQEALKEQRRVEFGDGILSQIIELFCASQYIEPDEYANTLAQLQQIFYLYKNESEDHLTDDELLTFMWEQFEGVCYGSLEYLEETCLDRFARAIRSGYCGYTKTGGKIEYTQFSEEIHWDRNLYLQTLKELFA